MTHSPEALRDWDCTPTALRAALDELAAMPADVTASRMIAIAVGVLIERFQITAEEAFDLIVAVGQQNVVGVCGLASKLTGGEDPESMWSAPAQALGPMSERAPNQTECADKHEPRRAAS